MGKENALETEQLGKRIKSLRMARAMSQAELAKAANISQSTITQLEKGLKDPTFSTLRGISNALNIPISKIVAEDGIAVINLKELSIIGFKVDDLSSEDYVVIDKIAKLAKKIGF